MKFNFSLPIQCDADVAAATLADPDFLVVARGDAPIGDPELVRIDRAGDRVTVAIRWRFTGDLNAAARAILEPSRLTWVQESIHDLSTRRVVFEIHPDNYADRLTCKGRYLISDDHDGNTTLRIEGEVRVRALLVASQVERILVDGLTQVLTAQTVALSDVEA